TRWVYDALRYRRLFHVRPVRQPPQHGKPEQKHQHRRLQPSFRNDQLPFLCIRCHFLTCDDYFWFCRKIDDNRLLSTSYCLVLSFIYSTTWHGSESLRQSRLLTSVDGPPCAVITMTSFPQPRRCLTSPV